MAGATRRRGLFRLGPALASLPTSLGTIYRIPDDNGQIRERRNQLRDPNYVKPELMATKPKELWTWEMHRATCVWALLVVDGDHEHPPQGERCDLYEIMEDRHGLRSTIMTSQLPPSKWHDHVGEPTLADAIIDRLLSNAHRIVLKGPSRRPSGAKEGNAEM